MNYCKIFIKISKFNEININNNKKINNISIFIKTYLFTKISFISLRINFILLYRVNIILIVNIEKEIFDILIYKFILKLIIIIEYNFI